jgi:hypothetical protein
MAGKKRKTPGSPGPSSGTQTFDYTKEFRDIKNHLSCAEHKGQLCHIYPVDGRHIPVKPEQVSLWAKEIVIDSI